MLRRTLLIVSVAILTSLPAGTALAHGWAGADPVRNFPAGQLPASCAPAGRSAACVEAAVSDLDQARASLGQGPYLLPADFASLTPAEQAFVLTDSDRIAAGLPPITGLTNALDRDATSGVRHDEDPGPSDSAFGYYASNWADGFANMPLAYEAWMYDDGRGSGNEDCTAGDSRGCWGHRHDVLWRFGPTGSLAMGAAAGTDSSGNAGYAMILGQGDEAYRPAYTYTWSQAVADGAGRGRSNPGPASIAASTSREARPSTPHRASAAGTPGRHSVAIIAARLRRHRRASDRGRVGTTDDSAARYVTGR